MSLGWLGELRVVEGRRWGEGQCCAGRGEAGRGGLLRL